MRREFGEEDAMENAAISSLSMLKYCPISDASITWIPLTEAAIMAFQHPWKICWYESASRSTRRFLCSMGKFCSMFPVSFPPFFLNEVIHWTISTSSASLVGQTSCTMKSKVSRLLCHLCRKFDVLKSHTKNIFLNQGFKTEVCFYFVLFLN